MAEDRSLEEIQEQLGLLNDGLIDSFAETLDLNADIQKATRVMAHNLLKIRQGFLYQAEQCLEIAQGLAEANKLTALLTGDLLSAEWGLPLGDEPFEEDEEEDEDE